MSDRALRLAGAGALATVLLASGIARADVIGDCPLGQHVVTNPATPGSGHHGGYHCEPGCSMSAIGAGRATTTPAALLFAAGAFVVAGRSGRARRAPDEGRTFRCAVLSRGPS